MMNYALKMGNLKVSIVNFRLILYWTIQIPFWKHFNKIVHWFFSLNSGLLKKNFQKMMSFLRLIDREKSTDAWNLIQTVWSSQIERFLNHRIKNFQILNKLINRLFWLDQSLRKFVLSINFRLNILAL